METENITQDILKDLTGLSKGRISQVLNNPGNMTIGNIVKFARAVGLKVSILAYDDNDSGNEKGPINSEIFRICWENAGKPHDFWSIQKTSETKQLVRSSEGYRTIMPTYFVSEMTKRATPIPGEMKTYPLLDVRR